MLLAAALVGTPANATTIYRADESGSLSAVEVDGAQEEMEAQEEQEARLRQAERERASATNGDDGSLATLSSEDGDFYFYAYVNNDTEHGGGYKLLKDYPAKLSAWDASTGMAIDNSELTWSSSDSSIASVERDGSVTVSGTGRVQITCTRGSVSKTDDFTAIEAADWFSGAYVWLYMGDSVDGVAFGGEYDSNGLFESGTLCVFETDATSVGLSLGVSSNFGRDWSSVTYSSSDTSIAQVRTKTSDSGGTSSYLEVSLAQSGTVTISAAADFWNPVEEEYEKKTVTTTLVVKKVADSDIEDFSINVDGAYNLDERYYDYTDGSTIYYANYEGVREEATGNIYALVKVNGTWISGGVEAQYSSSDNSVLNVSSGGSFTALKAGEATVTATLGSLTEIAKVRVIAKDYVLADKDITLNAYYQTQKGVSANSYTSMEEQGDSFALTWHYRLPIDGDSAAVGAQLYIYTPIGYPDSVTWTSSDPDAVSITEQYTPYVKLKFPASKPKTVTLTCKATFNDEAASKTYEKTLAIKLDLVSVSDGAVYSIDFWVSGDEVSSNYDDPWNHFWTIRQGTSAKLTPKAYDFDYNSLDVTDVSWTSSDPSVLAVDQNGNVTAKKAGEAYIILSANGLSTKELFKVTGDSSSDSDGSDSGGGSTDSGGSDSGGGSTDSGTTTVESQAMYRLYNPNSGEHFYTASAAERGMLKGVGWDDEGIGWYAPKTSNTPVYRMYNSNPSPKTGSGEHHYTTSETERDSLIAAGWEYEGIGWYSDDAKATPLYRLYNPNEFNNNHHYTTSEAERNNLLSLGWRDEGIAWYGV